MGEIFHDAYWGAKSTVAVLMKTRWSFRVIVKFNTLTLKLLLNEQKDYIVKD